MSSDTVFDALQNMEFVEGLEKKHLKKLAEIGTKVSFPAGETFFKEGEVSNVVYLIQEGQVAVEIFVPSRGRVTILTLGPGQLLGWSPLFAQRPNSASGRTTAPTQAIALDAAKLRQFCQTDHELGCFIGWHAAQVIANRLQATRLQLLDIFAHPA